MKYAEINKKFTEKVAEYLSMGYIVNTRTMAGRVCSGSKVDLTDGKEIIRIVLDRTNRNSKDAIILTVGRAPNDVYPNIPDNTGAIWYNRLETIEQYTWYRHDYRKDWFVTEGEEEAICAIHAERVRNAQTYKIKVFGEAAKKVVLSFIRRQPRHKTIKLSDIESVHKVTHLLDSNNPINRYEVRVKGKLFVLA